MRKSWTVLGSGTKRVSTKFVNITPPAESKINALGVAVLLTSSGSAGASLSVKYRMLETSPTANALGAYWATMLWLAKSKVQEIGATPGVPVRFEATIVSLSGNDRSRKVAVNARAERVGNDAEPRRGVREMNSG